jgi:hypothetical protein
MRRGGLAYPGLRGAGQLAMLRRLIVALEACATGCRCRCRTIRRA